MTPSLSIDVFAEMLEAAKVRTLAEMSAPYHCDADTAASALRTLLDTATDVDPVDDSEET